MAGRTIAAQGENRRVLKNQAGVVFILIVLQPLDQLELLLVRLPVTDEPA